MSAPFKPRILAPAGDTPAFLAAIAAGADAVYCGLKRFSARMAAKNFTLSELAALTALAHEKGVAVNVAFNALLKPDEIETAAGLLSDLSARVRPDALILQDPGLIPLARRMGFAGEIHLSTLANASFPEALAWIGGHLDVDRVVIPRELSIDEIRAMAEACPGRLTLEAFVHGALCYGVSGRCYWSSFLGGKSGLRGQCVQPCRRQYVQGKVRDSFFSCLDLGLDVLVKALKTIPKVTDWKIEGRRKGPHYVYYTVTAYKLLRDAGDDPTARKTAQGLLDQALGRPITHYGFLPQRPYVPIADGGETGSGRLLGAVKGGGHNLYLNPREPLLSGDLVRVGYEDQPGHGIYRMPRAVPAGGRFHLKRQGAVAPRKGDPVFLMDRREPALEREIAALRERLAPGPDIPEAPEGIRAPAPRQGGDRAGGKSTFMRVSWRPGAGGGRMEEGFWLTAEAPDSDPLALRPSSFPPSAIPPSLLPPSWLPPSLLSGPGGKAAASADPAGMPPARARAAWWWLPPVIWPNPAEARLGLIARIRHLIEIGARRFMLNAPWQMALFPDAIAGPPLRLWAGPFCNIANPLALDLLARHGFSGAIVSPELGGEQMLALARLAPMPVGAVLAGTWPLSISRTVSGRLWPEQPFSSPKGEVAWARRHGPDVWIYPNWTLDLREKRGALEKAGYTLFVTLAEPFPDAVPRKDRPGLWNWEHGLG